MADMNEKFKIIYLTFNNISLLRLSGKTFASKAKLIIKISFKKMMVSLM